jgi:hypothetical protein
MRWIVIATMLRGGLMEPEPLSDADALEASISLAKEAALARRKEWQQRWDIVNSTAEEKFA